MILGQHNKGWVGWEVVQGWSGRWQKNLRHHLEKLYDVTDHLELCQKAKETSFSPWEQLYADATQLVYSTDTDSIVILQCHKAPSRRADQLNKSVMCDVLYKNIALAIS